MKWRTIDSQQDLESFDKSVCWEDSGVLSYFASEEEQPYYPSDVSRSGFVRKNLHIVCASDSSAGPFLEMVFIHVDSIAGDFLERPALGGRVDSLRRVELRDFGGRVMLRCGRLLYRFLPTRPQICLSVIPEESPIREIVVKSYSCNRGIKANINPHPPMITNRHTVVLLLALVFTGFLRADNEPAYKLESRTVSETFSTRVLKVLSFEEGNSEYVAYVVDWKGHEVVVSAGYASKEEKRLSVGDDVRCRMTDAQQKLFEPGKSRLTFLLDVPPAESAQRLQAIADEIKTRRQKRQTTTEGSKP